MQRVDRGDSVRIPLLWIAVLVSVLLHAGLLVVRWQAPDKALPPAPDGVGKGALQGRLQPRVLPSSPAAREQPLAAPPQPVPQERRPPPQPVRPSVAKAPSAPPEVLVRPLPDTSRPAAPLQAYPPARPAAPPAKDFFDALREKQAQREAAQGATAGAIVTTEPGAEDENARRKRAIEENIAAMAPPMVGENNRQGGGIFQIKDMGIAYATFYFYGWNKEMRRRNTQMIEVARGSNPSMQLAVVRRMIEIIREEKKEDFEWESVRLRRTITRSARLRDTAELEAFLMAEFFRQ